MEMHSAESLNAVHGISGGDVRPYTKGIFARTFGRLSRAIGTMRRELAYRRAIAELARMDSRLLSDIGVGRGEIYAAVRSGRQREEAVTRLALTPTRGPVERRHIAAKRSGAKREAATQDDRGQPGFARLVALRTGAPC